MAQERVLGHALSERGLEGVDVVDALAGVGALAEEVLVDVRDGARVGVDAARARRRRAGRASRPARGQSGRDARLEDAVALDHAAGRGSKRGRFSGCASVPISCRAASPRQPRVGVERDDVADRRRAGRRRPSAGTKLVSVAPRSRRLSSCSLPRLRSQPIQWPSRSFQTPRAVEEEEALVAAGAGPCRAFSRAMPPPAPAASNALVVGQRLGGGVAPVGQQREAQLVVGVGEIVDLELLDQLLDLLPRG